MVFKSLDDEGRVAVERATDEEGRNFAVCEGKGRGEEGAGEHGGDGDVCCDKVSECIAYLGS